MIPEKYEIVTWLKKRRNNADRNMEGDSLKN